MKSSTSVVEPVSTIQIMAQPLSVNVADAARLAGCPRWTIAEAIRLRHLKAKKAGRTYLIVVADLQHYIDGLPEVGVA